MIDSSCEKIYHCATLIERNSSYDSIDELKRYWEEHKYYFTFTVSETKIKRMDELITSLYFASAKNDIYETNRICELIKALSNDIAAYEQPSFEAVF